MLYFTEPSMKTFRTTFVLFALFFTGLLVLWWLDYSGVPTEQERRERLNRVLPDLIDTPDAAIGRLEIDRGTERLVFERRGISQWQMKEPLDVAADPTMLETLVRNLKDLRKSPDSGTITGAAEAYGLAPPAASIRLWGKDAAATGHSDQQDQRPLAAMEIGKTMRDLCYVRPAGTEGIEVVDKKLLGALDRPAAQWRETNLVPIPTFQVARLSIHRDNLNLKAERGRGGRWRLTSPVTVPANGAKIESALAALSSIRVVDGTKGFAADNVSDFTPYGLDKPVATIELTTSAAPAEPLVLQVGKAPANQPERIYVRRGDQDEVALVDARFLTEIPRDSTTFRSQLVADIDPAAATEIQIQALGATFSLSRKATVWELKSPLAERADSYLVQSFLNQLDGLQTSEFLDPARVIRPELDPPVMNIKIWQTEPGSAGSQTGEATTSRPPALSLLIGRHDVLKKTMFGQLEGDNVILALPDSFLEFLPRNRYAFRNRGVLSLNPGIVSKLTLIREGRTAVLEPDRETRIANQWRMRFPIEAPADPRAITQALATLTNLRAEDFAADSVGDGKSFGLDQPQMVVSWELETDADAKPEPSKKPFPTHRSGSSLRIGKPVPGKPTSFYASLEGQPFVFTLNAAMLQPFRAEFHETLVVSYPADSVTRLVLRWPHRTLAFTRNPRPRGGPADWTAEPGSDPRGIDFSRFNDLVKQMSQLRTTRFYQYNGPIPSESGLEQPRLVLEVEVADGKPPRVVRIGNSTTEGLAFAAAGTGPSGPVFFLPALAWDALIKSGTAADELPQEVFAPATTAPK
jgi:hypothetical protein